MTDSAFPATIEELTPQVLTNAIATRNSGVVVESVGVASVKRCGEGIASTADRLVLDLRYGPGADGGLPERMVLKTMLASPHAPAAMYENEVRFYEELRPGLDIEAPVSFGSRFDPANGHFGLLMEDLTARGARFPNATDHVDLEEVRSILGHLAALHAAHWEDDRFSGGGSGHDLSWVGSPMSGGMFEVFDLIGLDLIEDQIDRNPFKQELIEPLGLGVPAMWEMLWEVQRSHCESPVTLLHGDPHIGNTYLLPGGRGGLLDWQLMMRGSWAHDVTYLLVTSMPTELRRSNQEDLLAFYLGQLRERGVDVPTEDDAWLRYRRAALWGLVIGWLITPPDNYGVQITAENIGRTVAAVSDLETFAAIG